MRFSDSALQQIFLLLTTLVQHVSCREDGVWWCDNKKRGAGSSDHVWSNKSGKLSRDTKYSVQADSETLYPLRYYWHSMVRISLSTPTLPPGALQSYRYKTALNWSHSYSLYTWHKMNGKKLQSAQ